MPIISLGDLMTRVYSRVDNNQLLYPQVEVIAAINEGIKLTNLLLGYYQDTITLPDVSQPDRLFYDLPAGVVFPFRVSFENQYLRPMSLNSIGQYSAAWMTATTGNTGMAVSNWIPVGLFKFAIWPADSVGGGQIAVASLVEPPVLVNPKDTISWSSEASLAFDQYAEHVIQLKESTADFSKASMAYNAYQSSVKRSSYIANLRMPRWWVDAGGTQPPEKP
jgi:hypothetical protein